MTRYLKTLADIKNTIIERYCQGVGTRVLYGLVQIQIMVLLVSVLILVNISEVYGITQFYFAIPEVIEDTTGITFSVDVDNRVYSWIDNGTDISPANNNTPNTQSDDTNIDLDANEYLLAIDDNLEIGTRVYMCVDIPRHFTQPTCETDAIDKDLLARAAFQFFFK